MVACVGSHVGVGVVACGVDAYAVASHVVVVVRNLIHVIVCSRC